MLFQTKSGLFTVLFQQPQQISFRVELILILKSNAFMEMSDEIVKISDGIFMALKILIQKQRKQY